MEFFAFLIGAILTVVAGQSCTTPNGEAATCISLLKCPALQRVVQDESSHAFIEASACLGGKFTVCCGTYGNFSSVPRQISSGQTEPTPESPRDYAIRTLIPNQRICGVQHTDDYFYNKSETSVDEFPWLVYFVSQQDYVDNFYLKKDDNCVGVLISDRYVLTLHDKCFKKFRTYDLNQTQEMLFGQHHIYKNVSCISTTVGVDDCTLPVLREVASNWNEEHYLANDKYATVSIVRLLKKLTYSDYVRPICLPLKEEDFPVAGDTIFSSGWGEPQFVNGKNIKLKKRVKYSLMSDDECAAGNTLDQPICGVVWDNNSFYICPSDNGGPLMYKRRNNWVVIGLVSVDTCSDIRPVSAEKLTATVVDWILNTIAKLEGLGNS